MIFKKNSNAHSSVTNTEVIVATENQKKNYASKSELCSVFKIVWADLKTVAPLAVPVERLTRGYPAPLVALYGPPFAY